MGFPLVDGGSNIVSTILGPEKYIEMIKSNAEITAKEALELGLINQVVHSSEINNTVSIKGRLFTVYCIPYTVGSHVDNLKIISD